jgi:hypothetical protein
MDLAVVMNEVALPLAAIPRFGTLPRLQVFAYPPASVESVPAAIVTYPLEVGFDATYGRGTDTMTLPVVLMVGNAADRDTRDLLAAYCSGAGTHSVKAAVEAWDYTSIDDVRVTGIDFDPVVMGGLELFAATFNLQIVGQGA